MFTGASSERPENARAGRRRLRGTLAVALILVSAVGLTFIFAAPQPASGAGRVPPTNSDTSPKNGDPFLEAKTLFQQGSIEEAKKKIQEQLALNPSVEGYNL